MFAGICRSAHQVGEAPAPPEVRHQGRQPGPEDQAKQPGLVEAAPLRPGTHQEAGAASRRLREGPRRESQGAEEVHLEVGAEAGRARGDDQGLQDLRPEGREGDQDRGGEPGRRLLQAAAVPPAGPKEAGRAAAAKAAITHFIFLA